MELWIRIFIETRVGPLSNKFHFCHQLEAIQRYFNLFFQDVRLIFLFGLWLGTMKHTEELWPKRKYGQNDSLVDPSSVPQVQKSRRKHMQQTLSCSEEATKQSLNLLLKSGIIRVNRGCLWSKVKGAIYTPPSLGPSSCLNHLVFTWDERGKVSLIEE